MKDQIRLALIGCGAVARIHHLPAIAGVKEVELTVLVDPSSERARALAQAYGIACIAQDYHEITNVDAAIVAAPNHLHAPIAIDLLRQGIHTLVEKPMALNARDGEQMVAAAEQSGAVLAVGMEMRFFRPARFIKEMVAQNLLGRIHFFDLRVGIISAWPAATDYFLHRHQSGGGVLIVHGVHVLDLLLWWLGDYEDVTFFDDALGGVEANCAMDLRLRSEARGTAEISRMRQLRNTCLIQGESAALEIELWEPNGRVYFKQGDDLVLGGSVGAGESAADIFQRQLSDFAEAIRRGQPPFVSGREALRALRLIDACYAARRPLEVPWMTAEPARAVYRRVA